MRAPDIDARISDAKEQLKTFIRIHNPGGCRMFSRGHECNCPLCLVDDLVADWERLRGELQEVKKFMDGICDTTRNRNPEGATILDFMTCWNEQYEQRIAELKIENERLRQRVAELEGNQCEGYCHVQRAIKETLEAMPPVVPRSTGE